MVSDHHDAEHGAHCTNDQCVMYYLNEGVTDAVAFVNQYVTTGENVIYGQECLDDVRAVADR